MDFFFAHQSFLASLFFLLCSAVFGRRIFARTSGVAIVMARAGKAAITPALILALAARSAAMRFAVSTGSAFILAHCAGPFFPKGSFGSAARTAARAAFSGDLLWADSAFFRAVFTDHLARNTAFADSPIATAPSPPAVMFVSVPAPVSARPIFETSHRSYLYAEYIEGTPNTCTSMFSTPYFFTVALQNLFRSLHERAGRQRIAVCPMPT